MLKRKTKFIIILAVILFAMCLFNANTVNAANQNSLDNVPDIISVEIPTTKALNGVLGVSDELKNIIEKKVKESITDDITGLYITSGRDYSNKFSDITKIVIQLSKSDAFTVVESQIIAEKTITIKYTDNWNTTDQNIAEKIAKNNIPSEYITMKYDYVSPYNEDYFWNNGIGNNGPENITQLLNINNSKIKVIYYVGAGGDPVWPCNYGRAFIYVNNVLYGDTNFGVQYAPVFTVPVDVEDTDTAYIDYVINILKTDKMGEGLDTIWNGYWGGNATIKPSPNGEKGSYIIYNSDSGRPLPLFIRKATIDQILEKDKATNIQLVAPVGVVPADTKLVVNEIKEGQKYNTIENVLKNTVDKMYIYDITLQSENVEIQPNGKVKISIPIPNGLDTDKIVIYNVNDNGTKTEYAVTIKNGYATFETDCLGTYVIAEKTENITNETVKGEKDETPKTGIENTTIMNIISIITILGIGAILLIKKQK